jgi:DNA-binding IclR family transcriptional regulator
LLAHLARQRQADFTIISSAALFREIPNLRAAGYLLFATHPMLEVANILVAMVHHTLTLLW